MDAPIVLAGCGMAGTAVLARLKERAARSDAEPPRVLVVDDGSGRLAERSWGFWSLGTLGVPPSLVTARWDRLRLRWPGHQLDVETRPYSYAWVTGPALLAERERLLALPWVEPVEARVEEVGRDAAWARLSDGRRLVARLVLDSVTPAPRDPAASASYAFTGWRVRAEKAVFDPAVATLMDFAAATGPGPRFTYVLPLGPREALVEHTRFEVEDRHGTCGGTGRGFDDEVRAYLDRLDAGAVEVLARETGAIVAGSGAGRHRGPVVRIGASAGAVRASTGYGLAAAWRQADVLAAAILAGRPPRVPRLPARHRWFDRTLLDLARHRPEQVQAMMLALFARNPTALALGFLDGATTPRQDAAIIARMPRAGIAGCLARQVAGRPGGVA